MNVLELSLSCESKTPQVGGAFWWDDPGRTRTYNQLIKSQLLCQLSYKAIYRHILSTLPALGQGENGFASGFYGILTSAACDGSINL